jgi:predicted RNase H-like nuclease (RuvC/YqgF family)
MDKNTLLETNNKIFELDGKILKHQKIILEKETELNHLKQEIESVSESVKVNVWSNSAYKNNDQRTAVLNKTLEDDEEFIHLKEREEELTLNIKEMKLQLEYTKAEKNFHKRQLDIFMLFVKE